ncbi:MAG TPA: hypothetical protein DCY94_00100 [Firmicutes bacterium]|nr:hypothetical protein [Bacillota bacterium]
MKSMPKNRILLVTALGLFVIGTVFILISSRIVRDSKSYNMSVRITTISDKDEIEYYTINYKTDGKIGKVDTTYLPMPLYIKNGKIIYREGNRFKQISSDKTYADIYHILDKIPLKNKVFESGEQKNYNPKVDEKIITELTDALVLGRKSKGKKDIYMTKSKNYLKEVTINLDDIEDFKNINILISFDWKDVQIDDIKVYREITDKVSNDALKIIDGS